MKILNQRTRGVWLTASLLFALVLCPQASAETVTNSYDTLNRLTSVVYGYGQQITYTYDAAGNRTATSSNTLIAPNAFTFTPQTNVALNTLVISNAITVTGINAKPPITISGGEYSINGGSYTSAPGNVSNGDTVTVHLKSAATYNTMLSAALTIGGVSGVFNVTTVTSTASTISLSPTSLSFTSQTSGTTSAAQTVMLTNTSGTLLSITGIVASGDFAVTGNCGTTLTSAMSCTISVTFKPTTSGSLTGAVTITSDAAGSPHSVSLSGSGVSVPSNLRITVTPFLNDPFNGTTLNTSLWTSGGNSATVHDGYLDLQANQTDNTGWVKTTFPEMGHIRVDLLHLMHPGGDYFFPNVTLGTTNVNGLVVVRWMRSLYGPDYCNIAGNYDKVEILAGITSGATCAWSFSNLVSSSYYDQWITSIIEYDSTTGLVTLDVNGDGIIDFSATVDPANRSPITSIQLQGYGWWTGHLHQIAYIKAYDLSSSTLLVNAITFGNQAQSTSSSAQSVTLTNTGGSTINISNIVSSGDFSSTNDCGTSLAASASCMISVTFNPTASGIRNGAVTITSDAIGSPHMISLSGTGTNSFPVLANLVAGWNLVGNSVDAPLDVATTFGDSTKITSVWKWTPTTSKWAFYAPTLIGQALTDYTITKGYDILTTIKGGEGFWVNAKAPLIVPQPAGNAINTAYFQDNTDPTLNKLSHGWNLISLGGSQSPSAFNIGLSVTPPVAGTTPTNVTTLWVWDSAQSKWYFYAPRLEAQGGTSLIDYITNKGYLDFTANGKMVGQGVGIWVNRP